ncbi:MAG TPA: TatA/E family twin arginine-targeting protein translocase [Thermomicrobiales bacterium]|nr:TatA/E family twin arginine-targeting protein translocase [Thermomicrobiales bacterium]
MNVFGMGTPEILVIMIVALIIFGPGKLPEIGAQVGKAVRDFRRITKEMTDEFEGSINDVQSSVTDVKETVSNVQKETVAIAQSIPSAIEGGSRPASSASPSSAQPTSAATREDPFADLAALDEAGDQPVAHPQS